MTRLLALTLLLVGCSSTPSTPEDAGVPPTCSTSDPYCPADPFGNQAVCLFGTSGFQFVPVCGDDWIIDCTRSGFATIAPEHCPICGPAPERSVVCPDGSSPRCVPVPLPCDGRVYRPE